MNRTIPRSLALIGLGLMLTACARHNPLEANCFNFRDVPPQAAFAATTMSTMGGEVSRNDTECDFVLLGTGG